MEFKTVLQLLLEAEKNEKEPDVTDYTDEPEDVEPPEEENPEDTEVDEPETDEKNPEKTTPDEDPTDYTDDDTAGEDEGDTTDSDDSETNPETTDETTEENPHRKNALLKDFISLFQLVKATQERVVAINFDSIETNQIVIQVSNLMLKLKDELFDYITGEFKKDKYVMSVFKYNQALQSMNILIEVIRKAKVIKVDTTKTKKKR